MIGIEKNLRRMTDEDIEILALRWSKEKNYLNARNVNCFIAALEMARQWLIDDFDTFLQDEGLYYQNEYRNKRVSDLGYSGMPLNEGHCKEFNGAKKFGELLIEASQTMVDNKVL